MPNHVANELVITGCDRAISNFINQASGIPIHWNGSEKPERIELLELSNFIHPELKNRGKELTIAYSKFGDEVVGYEWCIQNWGTKWGAYNTILKDQEWHGEGQVSYQFNTAWSTISPEVCLQMSILNPGLYFELNYFESLMGFQGTRRWHDNRILADQFEDYRDEQDSPFQYEPVVESY